MLSGAIALVAVAGTSAEARISLKKSSLAKSMSLVKADDPCAVGTPKHDRFEILYCDSHVCDVCAKKAEEEGNDKNFEYLDYCTNHCDGLKEQFEGCKCDGDDHSPIASSEAAQSTDVDGAVSDAAEGENRF